MVTVTNNHPGKTIPFGKGVYFYPGNNCISDAEKIKHLRKNRKSFEHYCETDIIGTMYPILKVVSGGLDEWVTGDPEPTSTVKGKEVPVQPVDGEAVSPYADLSEKVALGNIKMTFEVITLQKVIDYDTRKKVVAAATKKAAEMRA